MEPKRNEVSGTGTKQSMKHAFAVYACLTLLVLAVYAPVVRYGFVNYDDDCYMTDSPRVQGGFTWDTIRWAFTTGYFSNWHPLTWLSHMLDFRLFGLNPAPQHAENILLHILNSLLLFGILTRAAKCRPGIIPGPLWPSAFVAALFAIHPLHVESVAWISERKDVLSTFFGFLAIWMYLAQVERPAKVRYGLSVAFFALSVMTKSMLVTLPCILLLLDYWPLGRFRRVATSLLLVEKVPYVLVAVFAAAVAFAIRTPQTTSAGGRVAQMLYGYVHYMWLMIWPMKLAVIYPLQGERLALWESVAFAVILLVLTAVAFGFGKKRPYLIVGWLWYVITLVPASGLIQVGGHGLANRYTYVPLIGLFMCVAWGALDVAAAFRIPGKALAAAGCAILVAYTGLAHMQAAYWKDSETLMKRAVEVTRDNTAARYNLGLAYLEQKKDQEAADQFYAVLKIEPENVLAITNLGVATAGLGKPAEAARMFYIALTLKPDDVNTLVSLGATLIEENEIDEALVHLGDALAYDPNNAEAHYNMALALDRQGKRDEACKELAAALRLKPQHRQGEALKQKICG